jgi:hypothetical protein
MPSIAEQFSQPIILEQIIKQLVKTPNSIDLWKRLEALAGHRSIPHKLFLAVDTTNPELTDRVIECFSKVLLNCDQLVELSLHFIDHPSKLVDAVLTKTVDNLRTSPKKVSIN